MFCLGMSVFKLSKEVFMTISGETPFALLEERVDALGLVVVESAKVPLGLNSEDIHVVDVVFPVSEELEGLIACNWRLRRRECHRP